jgi:porphobilinogen synthase
VAQALRFLAAEFPSLLLMADVCMCAYTNHGHCGVVHDNGVIDNEKSIKRTLLIYFYLFV